MASITDRFRGDRLRDIREHAGLYQRQLADLCTARGVDVAQSNISQWELGWRTPQLPTLKLLAEVLACDIDDLLEPATVSAS